MTVSAKICLVCKISCYSLSIDYSVQRMRYQSFTLYYKAIFTIPKYAFVLSMHMMNKDCSPQLRQYICMQYICLLSILILMVVYINVMECTFPHIRFIYASAKVMAHKCFVYVSAENYIKFNLFCSVWNYNAKQLAARAKKSI